MRQISNCLVEIMSYCREATWEISQPRCGWMASEKTFVLKEGVSEMKNENVENTGVCCIDLLIRKFYRSNCIWGGNSSKVPSADYLRKARLAFAAERRQICVGRAK